MSLNNFLCKYFKDEDSRYVTAAGFLNWLGLYIIVLSVVVGLLYCIGITVLHLVTGQLGGSTDGWVVLIETLGVLAIFLLLSIIWVVVWELLSTIKLAECPLQKEGEKP